MTNTIYKRKIDSRGRISLPKLFRIYLKLEKGDEVYFSMENKFIILRKIRKGE